jgi:excisionase family DNA binding protein
VIENDDKIRPLWPEWLTREDFARKHGVSVRTLYRWIQSGEAEVSKTPEGKRYRVKESAYVPVDNSENHKISNTYLGDIACQLTEIARQLGHLAVDSRTIARKVDAADLKSVLHLLERIGDRAAEGARGDQPGGVVGEPSSPPPLTTLERQFPDEPSLVAEVQKLMEELAAGDLYTPSLQSNENDEDDVIEAPPMPLIPPGEPVSETQPSWRETLAAIFVEGQSE